MTLVFVATRVVTRLMFVSENSTEESVPDLYNNLYSKNDPQSAI